jgi:RNA polymerase sigma-70 factor (ECF subfamily)
MTPHTTASPEILLAQADWVRALVRKLVVDESSAEDIVQSTWLAAMTHSLREEASAASVRAWLAKVSRHLALRSHRDDVRRGKREEGAAREERLPSTAEVAEREDMRRRIVGAVLSLDEPYRTTLVLRYYEELSPRDIARAQDVNASTVRNRIARGHALLRERFERERGSQWRSSLLLALPRPSLRVWPAHVETSKWWIGGGLVASGAKIAGAVLLIVGVASLWRWMDSRRRAPDLVAATSCVESNAGDPASNSIDSPLTSAADEGSRRVVPAESAAAPARIPNRCELEVTLLTPDGAKLDRIPNRKEIVHRARSWLGAREVSRAQSETSFKDHAVSGSGEIDEITVAPSELTLSTGKTGGDGKPLQAVLNFSHVSIVGAPLVENARATLTNDHDNAYQQDLEGRGSFSIGGLTAGTWHLAVQVPGFLSCREDVEIREGESSKHVDVSLQPIVRLKVKLSGPRGEDIESLLDAIDHDAALGGRVQLIAFATHGAPGEHVPVRHSGDCYGAGIWFNRRECPSTELSALDGFMGVLELHEPLPVYAGISSRGFVLASKLVSAGEDTVEFVLSLDEIKNQLSSAMLRVVDGPSGLVLSGATVDLDRGDYGKVRVSDVPDVVFEGVTPGLKRLSISAPKHERVEAWVEIRAGCANDLGTWSLDPATSICGSVVDPDGRPIQCELELCSIDHLIPGVDAPSVTSARSNAEGRFEFHVAGRHRYVVRTTDGTWAAAPVLADASGGAIDDLVIHAAKCFEIVLAFPVEPPEDSYYSVETEDGLFVSSQRCCGLEPFRMRLGYGSYRVRLMQSAKVLSGRRVHVHDGGAEAGPEHTTSR